MSLIETFEKLCDEYGVEYTRDGKKRGLVLSLNGEEFEITRNHINSMFKFDVYYNMKPNEVIEDSFQPTMKIHKSFEVNITNKRLDSILDMEYDKSVTDCADLAA